MKLYIGRGTGLALFLSLIALCAAGQSQAPSNSQSSEGSSLGDYAKQVRKSEPRGKARTFDNDNLPKDDKLSIVGSAAESSSSTSSTTDASAPAAAPAPASSENKSSPEGAAKAGTQPASQTQSGQTGQTPASQAQTSQSQPATEEKPSAGTPKPIDQEQAGKEAKWKEWGDKMDSQKEQISLLTRELDVLQREYQLRAAAMYGDAGNRMRNKSDWDKQDAEYKQQIADKQKALDDAKQKLDDMQEDGRKAGVPASIREP